MKIKKIGAIFCALSMILPLLPQGYTVAKAAIMPETSATNLAFSDDFEIGSGNWTFYNEQSMIREEIDAKAVLASTFYVDEKGERYASDNTMSLKNSAKLPFRHSVIDITFKRNAQTSGYAGPRFNLIDETGTLLTFVSQIQTNTTNGKNYSAYLRHSVSNMARTVQPFNYEQPCDVRIVATSDKFYIYAKQGDDDYGTAYEAARESDTDFTLQISGHGVNYYIDDINVYDLDYADATTVDILESPLVVFAGESITPTVKNAAGATYSIEDTSIATVSGNVVRGVAPGTTTLTVTANGVSDTVPVIVRKKATQIITNVTTAVDGVKMSVGDKLDVRADFGGAEDITENDIMWETSDESVVSLFGKAREGKTIIAEGEGTAIITARLPYGISKTFSVIVEDNINTAKKKTVGRVSETPTHAVNKLVFGAVGSGYSDIRSDALRNIGVTNIRFSYTDTTTIDGLRNFVEAGFYPVVLLGDVNYTKYFELGNFNETQLAKIDEIVEIMDNGTGDYSHIRIELGNEPYNYSHLKETVDGVSCKAYIDWVNEIAPLIKAKYPTIKIGVPVMELDTAFTTAIRNNFENTNLVDAYIDHIYSTVSKATGQTADTMIKSIYLRNQIHRVKPAGFKEAMAENGADKEIWITEYGNINDICLRASGSWEKSRLQFNKSISVALANTEKMLNFLEDDDVTIAQAYGVFDIQGFGWINGNNEDGTALGEILPGYYSNMEMGRLINNYDQFYKVDNAIGHLARGSYYVDVGGAGGNQYFDITFDEVHAWGFGDSSGVKEIVISNRDSVPKLYSLEGKTLTKTWEYSDSEIITDYLTNTGYAYGAKPCEKPVTQGFGAAAEEIVLAPNSLTVCTVADGTDKAHLSASIASGESSADISAGGIDLTFSKAVSKPTAYLKHDDITSAALSVSGGNSSTQFAVSHGKLLPETDYILSVTADGVNYEIPFRTRASSVYDGFTEDTSLGLTTTNTNYPDQSILTFTVNKDSSATTALSFYIADERYYIRNELISGDDINGGYVVGHDHFPADTSKDYKFIFNGPLTEIYSRTTGTMGYQKVGEILTPKSRASSYSTMRYTSTNGFSVSNVSVLVNKSDVSDIKYAQETAGNKIDLWRVFKGETIVNFTVNSSDFNIFLVEYKTEDEKELNTMYVKDETDGTNFEYILDSSDLTKQKIMIFDANAKSLLLNAITNRQ